MKRAIAVILLGFCSQASAQPLSTNAPASAVPPPVSAAAAYSRNPTGQGNPDAITCRPPQPLPGERLLGPEVCKTNAVWARYRRDGMTVAADGIHDVPSEKWRTTNPQACHPATMGGGATTANLTTFSMVCE